MCMGVWVWMWVCGCDSELKSGALTIPGSLTSMTKYWGTSPSIGSLNRE